MACEFNCWKFSFWRQWTGRHNGSFLDLVCRQEPCRCVEFSHSAPNRFADLDRPVYLPRHALSWPCESIEGPQRARCTGFFWCTARVQDHCATGGHNGELVGVARDPLSVVEEWSPRSSDSTAKTNALPASSVVKGPKPSKRFRKKKPRHRRKAQTRPSARPFGLFSRQHDCFLSFTMQRELTKPLGSHLLCCLRAFMDSPPTQAQPISQSRP